MAPMHWDAQAGRFRMTVPWGLLLSVLIYRTVSDSRCPEKAPGPADCPHVSRKVSKGSSVNISLNTLDTTLDLCKQNGSTPKWDLIYSFVKGVPTKLRSDFQEQVSVCPGSFVVENVSAGAGGNYVFQDTNGKCLTHVMLTVVGVAAAWYWCMFLLLSLLRGP